MTVAAATGCLVPGCGAGGQDEEGTTESAFSLSGDLALGRPVTTNSSWFRNLGYADDGVVNTNLYANLNGGCIWVQIDLGKSYTINQVQLWHYFGDGRTYHDVIVQLSTTADLSAGVTTIFNNDANGTCGQAVGRDGPYAETSSGKTILLNTPVTARYVRFSSNGSNVNPYNHYVEAAVFGAIPSLDGGAPESGADATSSDASSVDQGAPDVGTDASDTGAGGTGNVFFVSPGGNNGDGKSWATAWTDTTSIRWSSVAPGDTIELDGGTSKCSVSPYDFQSTSPNPGVTCGQRYSPFGVGADSVTISRSKASGHDGTVVVDGGRDIPLPYCHQTGYSAPTGASNAIDLANHSHVTIDGLVRSGIVVRGSQRGVRMGTGSGNTLRNLELFDNGFAVSSSGGGSATDGEDILLNGQNNTYDRLLVHDGGQDAVHSDPNASSEAGSRFLNSWIGSLREHPQHVGEPFNDLQKIGDDTCTHADSIQIFAPATTMAGLTVDHSILGPGMNQGLYPSDGGTGTTFDNVTITNTLFLDAVSHNIITDNAVNGWLLDHVTIFATQGGMEIPSNGTNTMTHTIKYGGYVFVPGGSWTTSANVWFQGDPLPGSATNTDPKFASAPTGSMPSFASLFAADLTPSCSVCAGIGSPLHKFGDILRLIDSLN